MKNASELFRADDSSYAGIEGVEELLDAHLDAVSGGWGFNLFLKFDRATGGGGDDKPTQTPTQAPPVS